MSQISNPADRQKIKKMLGEVSDSMTEKEASVDEKIDSYLLQYEKEAVPLDSEKEKLEEFLSFGAKKSTIDFI